MKKGIAVGAVLAVTCATASGEFTAQEKTEFAKLVRGANHSTYTIEQASRHANAVPTDVPKAVSYGKAMADAYYQHVTAMMWLLDVKGSGDRLAEAWTLLDDVIARWDAAKTTLDSMAPSSFRATALSELAQARTQLTSFNRTLAYEQPRLDVNLATPGASPSKSATAGPHGDYTFGAQVLFDVQARQLRDAWKNAFDAVALRPQMADHMADFSFHIRLTALHINWAVGLWVGVEQGSTAAHVETMFRGGTTTRGREFFQILLAQEMMLNRVDTQTPQYVKDVNGRTMIRGSSYDLTRMCQELSRTLREDASLPSYVHEIAWSYEHVCDQWQALDSGVFNGSLGLKHFQVFPPHPPSPEICALCPGGGGGCPDCEETPEPSSFCDPATTTWNGEKCVSTTVCPSFEGVLVIGNKSIDAQCVEVPK